MGMVSADSVVGWLSFVIEVKKMARDGGGMGSIVGIAAAAGLAYWAYTSGLLSSILGTSTTTTTTTTDAAAAAAAKAAADAAAATATTNSTAAAAAAAKAAADAAAAAAAPKNTGPCPLTGVLSPALALAQKAQGWTDPNDPLSVLSMDQWNYYLGQVCTGLSTQVGAGLDAGAIFPNDPTGRGGPLNWTAYKGYATQAGLSGARIAGSGMGTHLARRRGVSCC